MHEKRKWLLSTLLLSSLGVQSLAPPVSAEAEAPQAPDEQKVQNQASDEAFVEVPAEVVREVAENRTLYSKEYLLSDDSRETVLSAAPLHYRGASGSYQDIRLSLTLQADLPAENESQAAPSKDESHQPETPAEEPLPSSETGNPSLQAATLPATPSPEAQTEAQTDEEESPADPAANKTDSDPTSSDEASASETPDLVSEQPDAPASESGSAYTSSTVPYTPNLHNAYTEGFSLGANGHSVTLIPIGAQDAQADVSAANQGVLTYSNVWTSTAAKLALTPSGIEQTLTLTDASAPSEFSFTVHGDLGEDLTGGGLAALPAWLIDASGERREVSQNLIVQDGVRTLHLQADTSGLTYPVELRTGLTLDSPAQQAVTADSNLSAASGTSLMARSAAAEPQPQDERTYLQFDLSALPAGTPIREAYLTSGSADSLGDPDTLRVLRAAESWTEATLATEEPRTALRADGASYGKLRTDSEGVQRIELDPDLVTRWLTSEEPNYGMQIEGAESSALNETPQLHIRYGGESVNTLSAAGTPMQFQYVYDNQSRLQYILFSTGERINFTYDTSGNLIKRQYVPGP